METILDDAAYEFGANQGTQAEARSFSADRVASPPLRYHRRTPIFVLCCAQLSYPGPLVLIELRLENYAVIDNLVVEFGPGLNLLTGETGAGKSILIDALALLLGEKASTNVIRGGVERALIAAVFEVARGAADAVTKLLE